MIPVTMSCMLNAKIPTAMPTTPHKVAILALLIFSGSPFAVKNKMPAIINIITAIAVNITQTASAMFPSTDWMLKPAPGPAKPPI